MWIILALAVLVQQPTSAFIIPGTKLWARRLLTLKPSSGLPYRNKPHGVVVTEETPIPTAPTPTKKKSIITKAKGQRLNPNDVAKSARKEFTHILILPGFATSTADYTKEGSLAPNLIGRGGWKKEQIHAVPMERLDWLNVWRYGLMDGDFVAALMGMASGNNNGGGAPPDRPPYRWYLKRVSKAIREIDESVKAEHGPDATAKVILIGHSAGGWLARAAVGFGCEHRQNSTVLSSEIGIDIDNILAFVTLGTPHLSPPEGSPDVTGGAIQITNERFPGSYFEDKVFYLTAAGSGVAGHTDALARQAYEMVSGDGLVDGDGIVPIDSAHLDGATQMNIENIRHAAQLVADSVGAVWYGSDVVVDEWFGEVLNQLTYIQGGEQALRQHDDDETHKQGESAVELLVDKEAASGEESTEQKFTVEDYFRRRNALRHSGIFSRIPNRKAFENVVYSMEGYTVPNNTKLFSQGDESDAMFFVSSGKLECYDENTGEVMATVEKNAVVGELGVLLNEPRALSVRAATPDVNVYKLSSEDINKYVLGKEQSEAALSLEDVESYDRYFEDKAKRDALKACPLFKELGEYDVKRLTAAMQRMELQEGDRIIEEGTRGGTMYFVEEGGFACYRESNKNVVKVCNRHDYFGELGVIFEQPRAVSVRATEPSIVWELHGDDFLDCYRKMTAAKFGAAAWVLAVGKITRADKWIGRLIPKPLSRTVRKLRFAIGDSINRYQYVGGHFQEKRRKGTNVHLSNAVLSAAIPPYVVLTQKTAGSAISKFVMALGFSGLVFDNLINASGKYIGEGDKLRSLCKLRTISHALTIPLLFLPVIETATNAGLFSARCAKLAMSAVVAFALHEVIDWISFDTKDMVLVDNRDSDKHSPRALAGTLWYSSGKVFKNVFPAAVLQLVMLLVGTILWRRGAPGGPWLLAAGVLTLTSCSLQRPDIQAYGEPAMMMLLWLASLSQSAYGAF